METKLLTNVYQEEAFVDFVFNITIKTRFKMSANQCFLCKVIKYEWFYLNFE